jgi:Lipase maturation factor
METAVPRTRLILSEDTYWLTRFVILRWMGFVYLVAFYVAARQLVPLVGENGLTPAALFFPAVTAHFGDSLSGFLALPSLFWLNYSDAMLRVIPWVGVIMSIMVLAGYANALMMTVLWFFYVSIVHAGQDWYGYGWEIQMSETGFLCIFLCPLLDARPFPLRPPPIAIIFLFRWLIVRIMLGSALIKLRGDSCWTDLTALYYHFETQPIPNPISRYFHFLPHPVLQFGVIWTFVVELISPVFCFWPRWGRYIAGAIIISFQFTLIVSGNLSFFNWLTILPALACFDDRFWRKLMPTFLTSWAVEARLSAKPSAPMEGLSWVIVVLVGFLSIEPVLNLVAPGEGGQRMNASFEFDTLHLVNTYGAFGSVGRDRPVIIFEGTDSADPETATDWKEYPYVGSPWDPKLSPPFIAPYQPHLDWQLWFAAMASYREYPWTLNLVWKLLHNDPATLGLFAGNPFPDHPPHYIRAVLYTYHFAQPGNPEHLYWNRDKVGPWLPAFSVDSPELKDALHEEGWLK